MGDGIWVSRVNHSPRTSTAYIYLYVLVFAARSDCSADKAEKVVYFYTKIRHFKNFEPNSFVSYLVFLTFQGIISLSPFIDRDDFANPKCWKSSCRDLRIIATFSNQPILNSRKERRKNREREKKLDRNSWSGNDRPS